MAKAKGTGTRGKIFRLVSGRVDIATGVILALLWQAKASAAAAGNGEPAQFHNMALPGEATLLAAIERDASPTISIDELRALLTPQELARLGLDPEVFGDLLISDPKAALLKLDAAFKGKLKLVAATAPGKTLVTTDAATDGGGEGSAASFLNADEGAGGNGILYALGGLFAAAGTAGIATGSSSSSGGTAAPAILPVPTNTAPVASADTITTTEDNAISFDVRTNDSDANGDPLAVTAINGTAITATSPVTTTGGSISLGTDGRLTFTPAANFNGPVSFTYTVSDGKGGTATATTSLTITAVNDAPTNAGPQATVAAAQGTSVAISGLSISDVDAGSSMLTTTLAVTNGALFAATVTDGATIAGAGSATLVLTGTVAQINASLAAITFRGGNAGTDSLTVTTTDGVATDTDSFAINIVAVQTGVVSDGYVAGGTVFVDVNDNGIFDEGEPTAQTDGNGNFSIVTNAVGTIIAFGGINTDTGLANQITMRAVAGSTVINPLTTIVEQLVANGATLVDANASVAATFGLPAGIDFGSFDILAATDPVLGLAAQKAASLVATLLTLALETAGPEAADAAQAAVLARISALVADGPVDFGDPAQLRPLFTDVPGIDAEQIGSLVATAGTILETIAAATSLDNLEVALIDGSTLPPAPNQAPVPIADTVATTIGAAVTFNPAANDRDANGDTLAITAIGGTAIATGESVGVDGGRVVLNDDGSLTFTPDTAFTGSPQFSYTVSDGAGGTADGLVTVAVLPAGASVDVAAADITTFADNAGALAAAGVTTFDLVENAGTLSDAEASMLVGAGIDFAEADTITVAAQGTELSTSLKGLQDLNVDSVAVGVGIGMMSVDAGATGLGGLSATGLPSFVTAQSDAAVDVTLNLAGGTIDPALDLGDLAPALAAAGIDHLGVVGGGISLSTAQAADLGLSGLGFAGSADVTLITQAGELARIAGRAGDVAASGIDHIDIVGDAATLADADAGALIAAGLDFAEADNITVSAEGTHLATTMKGLQDLNVDSVAVGVGIGMLSVDAGAAGLGGLSATGLPSFVTAQSDAAVDVTLNLAGGTIDPALDLGDLAPALAAAGIDQLGVVGGGISLSTAQAADLGLSGLGFAGSADVTLITQAGELAGIAGRAGDVAAIGVDHIDIVGNAATLADADAGALIAAGLDFAEADNITVSAEGTHLATTMKGLQDLNVDSVVLGAGIGMLSVEAGAAGFGGLAASGVPLFRAVAGNPDITLTQAGGTLDAGVDLALLAPALAAAGIDHLGTTGDGGLSVTLDQASALTGSGVDFAAASDITVRFADADAGSAASQASGLAAVNVDHLSVIDGVVTISDSQAGQFISAGLDFADSDDVSVAAEGTQLSTTLKGLQDLHVDSVSVQPGVQTLHIAAGDLAAIAANGLPQFDTGASSPLDVTLAIATADLAELPRLAEALRAAGVDHIAIDTPLDGLDSDDTALLADITATTGIDFVEMAAPAPFDMLSSLLAELESEDAQGQTIEINDSVVASIVQAGMLGAYLAENVTIDATSAGDKPMTSLKSVADLQVDAVLLADQHNAAVYIDLGIDANAIGELQSLFAALDPGTGYSKIFTGSDHVALVVDARTADLLAGVDGALGHLAQLGFTEIDVLGGDNASLLAGDGTIEVKLIGQDDDLYDYLNHGRA